MNITSLNKVLSFEYLKNEINDLYENGMPTGLKIGVSAIDDLFRLDTAMVSIITGVPNYGKSEFLDFLNVRLNKLYGLKSLYFSPENFPVKRHLAKMLSKLTNKSFNDLAKEEIDTNIDYISDNFYFLNYETVSTLDDILNEAEILIENNDIKIINIDPYNTLEDQRPSNLTETEYVSQVMTRLQKFAKKHNVLINLVVHPKKMPNDANGDTMMPSRYDLNGSANFANKADYIIVVHRDFYNDTTIIKCEKCKFSNYGRIGSCDIKYDTVSTNYFDIDNKIDAKQDDTSKQNDMYIIALEVMKQSKTKEQTNILDVNVSFFEDKIEKKGTIINLYNYLLDADKQYYNKYNSMVKVIRMAKTDEERKVIKNRTNLPCVTVSCLTGEDKADIVKVNPIMCIDIDKKDNLTIIDRVPSIVKSLSCVAYFSKSVSGNGYYCIIPILYTDRFKEHFNALQKDFYDMGITIDKSCSNPNRLRYYSFDDDAYINIHAEVYTTLLELKKHNDAIDIEQTKLEYSNDVDANTKQIMDMIKYLTTYNIDITKNYDDWLHIGAAIANTFADKGYILFDGISRISKKYSSYECEDKYQSLLNNPLPNISLGTVFYIYSKYKKQYEEMNNPK